MTISSNLLFVNKQRKERSMKYVIILKELSLMLIKNGFTIDHGIESIMNDLNLWLLPRTEFIYFMINEFHPDFYLYAYHNYCDYFIEISKKQFDMLLALPNKEEYLESSTNLFLSINNVRVKLGNIRKEDYRYILKKHNIPYDESMNINELEYYCKQFNITNLKEVYND